MYQDLIFLLTSFAFLTPIAQCHTSPVAVLPNQQPLSPDDYFIADPPAPPSLHFPANIWDPEADPDRVAKVKAAYTEAFKLAQYAIKDVVKKPLDVQHPPQLYFPPNNLKRNGTVEKVLRLFTLRQYNEDLSYIFKDITVVKGTTPQFSKENRVAAFITPSGEGGTTKSILTICNFFWNNNEFSNGLLQKPCNKLCDKPDNTWVSLSSILLHELLHIKEVAIKGKPNEGAINDIEMHDYKKASPECRENGAYGWKCTRELNKWAPKYTHMNADNYMWMVIEQLVEGRCFKGRSEDACKK